MWGDDGRSELLLREGMLGRLVEGAAEGRGKGGGHVTHSPSAVNRGAIAMACQPMAALDATS